MKRAQDPAFLELIANNPRVFKNVTCKGVDRIELSSIWNNCVGLEFDTGGFLFHRHDPGVYEVHTLFLPKSKNVQVYAAMAANFIFNLDAELLLTQVARDLPHVRRLALSQGFTKFDEGFLQRDSGDIVTDYYELSKESWKEMVKCQSPPQ